MAERAQWIDLIDPTEAELRKHLPEHLHPTAVELLLEPHVHDDEPRPRIDSHDTYIVGILLIAVAKKDEDRIFFQEIDFVLTPEALVTISKTPPGEKPFDPKPAMDACKADEHVGMFAFRLVDEIAERYLDLIDDLNDEIDELEDHVEDWTAEEVRGRISSLRHDLLGIRRTLTPTRDAVHKIVDDRVEIVDHEIFPRDVELHFADAYDKLLRASEGLETSRDLVAGVRDYLQARVANDQNEVMKRLTVIASLLLVPTFIVGLYGQNFRHIPELDWGFGYWWSWGLILVTTAGQLAFFRWKKWL
ncbi:MAG TPA: magnesium transporter CorA family protein [Gaiellaceae bacterium]